MRLAMLCALVAVALGCGGPTHREPDEYTGCGTDEHWVIFDDNEPSAMASATSGPTLTSPAAGAKVSSSTKPILHWNQDPADAGMNTGDVAFINGPGCNDCCPEFNPGALTTLHDPAISGDVFDLQFTIGGKYAWRVVTTLQEWTPTDALWAQMKGQTVSVKIYRMTLLINQIKAGPYVAPAPSMFAVSS